MNQVDIVQLEPEAWPAYKELRLEALRTDPQAYGASYEASLSQPDAHWEERLKDAADNTASWLLFARHGERLVGMIGAYTLDEGNAARVIAVYVTPNARGHGVATQLMGALLDELRKHAWLKKAILDVNVEQVAAIALYRRFGFEVTSEQTMPLGDGKNHDEYVMEKRLM